MRRNLWSAAAWGAAAALVIGACEPQGPRPAASEPPAEVSESAAAPPASRQAAPVAAEQPPAAPYLADAGRSPIPQPGESFDAPLPAVRLPEPDPPPPVSTLPPPDGPIPWTEAHRYLGQTVTVEGTIVGTRNIGRICFLNFHPDWRNHFYLALFDSAFDGLGAPPEDYYLDQRVRATGEVALHRDRVQMEIRDPSRIVRLGPADRETLPDARATPARPAPQALTPTDEAATP